MVKMSCPYPHPHRQNPSCLTATEEGIVLWHSTKKRAPPLQHYQGKKHPTTPFTKTMLLDILYLRHEIKSSSQEATRTKRISEQLEENQPSFFQQGFPRAWSKFQYFHPCQNNFQAPPNARTPLSCQTSFIYTCSAVKEL